MTAATYLGLRLTKYPNAATSTYLMNLFIQNFIFRKHASAGSLNATLHSVRNSYWLHISYTVLE